jgi:hypothetical protein
VLVPRRSWADLNICNPQPPLPVSPLTPRLLLLRPRPLLSRLFPPCSQVRHLLCVWGGSPSCSFFLPPHNRRKVHQRFSFACPPANPQCAQAQRFVGRLVDSLAPFLSNTGHNTTMPGVHSVQTSHGLASMGSRGPASVVPGLGTMPMNPNMNIGVASIGSGGTNTGASTSVNGPRSGAGASTAELSGLGRYGAATAGPGLSMPHAGPAMHNIGQLGTRRTIPSGSTANTACFNVANPLLLPSVAGMGGSARSGQAMTRGQMGVNLNIGGGPSRPQASHAGMVGPAGLNPPASSSPPINSTQLRQGAISGQSVISMPSPSNSYNPSVDLFTMINRQGTHHHYSILCFLAWFIISCTSNYDNAVV